MSGFTKVPNELLDAMATLEHAQFKLLMAIYRLTAGYNKPEARISLTRLEDMTGLSRPHVVTCANKLEELGLITRKKDGGVTIWSVNSVNQVVNSVNHDRLTELTGVVNSVNQTSKLSLPPSIKDNYKEKYKDIDWETVLLLVNHFVDISHCRLPHLNGQGWNPHVEAWIYPVMDLLVASDYKTAATKKRITAAIETLREKGYTIATPKSIYNTALSVKGLPATAGQSKQITILDDDGNPLRQEIVNVRA